MRTRTIWIAAFALACNSPKNSAVTITSASVAASGTPSATASTSTTLAAKPLACTVSDAISIETQARLDAGITLVTLRGGEMMLGYGTGAALTKVALLDSDGKAQFLDTGDEKRTQGEHKLADTKRMMLRVTPLDRWEGFESGGVNVGVDLLDKLADGSTHLRCGPSDSMAYFEEGPTHDAKERTIDCRTFGSGHKRWALASVMGAAVDGKAPIRWTVNYATGRSPVETVILDEKIYDEKKLEKPETYAYQVPIGVGVHETGFVFASRQDGSLVVARRDAHLQKVGEAVRFGFGGAAPTVPALAVNDPNVALFVGLFGKTDVYGVAFAIDAAPNKPEKLALDDPNPPAAGDRNSLTASYAPKGDIFLAFADGVAGAKRPRMTVLDATLKSRVPVFDIGDDTNISEVRVVALGEQRALVAYLARNTIKTSIVSCKY